MRGMTPVRAESDLRQRLEGVRLRGARQRLELALALEELADHGAGLRRGAALLVAAARWLGAWAPGAPTDSGRGTARWQRMLRLLATAVGIAGGIGTAPHRARLRRVADLGALALLLYRLWRRRRKAPA